MAQNPPQGKSASEFQFDQNAEIGLVTSFWVVPERFPEFSDISPRCFFRDDCRVMWEAMLAVHADGGKTTHKAVQARLAEQGKLSIAESKAGMIQMFQDADTGNYIHYYADIVREKSRLRNLQLELSDISNGIARGADLGSVIERLSKATSTNAPKPTTKRLRYLTGDDLKLENFPLTPIIDGIMFADHTMAIGAVEKAGKTTVALHMALSIATGTPFLGRFDVPEPRRAIFYSGESGASTLIQNATLMCKSIGHDLTKIPNFILSDTVPRIGDESFLREVAADMAELRPAVVFIDPFYKAMVTDKPSDMFAMGKLLISVQDICRPLGITVVYVHHVRKPDRSKPQTITLQDLAFSGLSQDVRQWILIERREEFVAREPEKFRFHCGGSPNGLGQVLDVDMDKYWHEEPDWRRFSITAVDAAQRANPEEKEEAKADARRAQLDADIEKLVREAARFPDGQTKTVLRDLASLRGARLEAAISSALLSRKLERCQVITGNQKTPKEGFCVPKQDQWAQSA